MSNYIETTDYAGKVFLVCILPGLGKSFLAKNHNNVIDYKDWCDNESKGSYSSRSQRHVAVDLQNITCTKSDILQSECIFILSSIPWENFELQDLETGIYIHMEKGCYTAEELSFRSRYDLVIDHYEDLENWNDDLLRLAGSSPKHLNNHYILYSGEFITITSILRHCEELNSISTADILSNYASFFNRNMCTEV